MIYIYFGLAGFCLIHLADLATIRKREFAKPVVWACGIAVFVFSVMGIIASTPRFVLDSWLVVAGLILLIVSILVLVYALFINLPFKRTYVDSGTRQPLIKTGLYGVVRHPGLYPFVGVMAGLIIIFPSRLMLLASIVWTLANIALIIYQDKVIFPRMFSGYHQYQRETPMIIPKVRDLGRIVGSLKKKRHGVNKLAGGKQD